MEYTLEELQEYKNKIQGASVHDIHCVMLAYELVPDLIDEVIRYREFINLIDEIENLLKQGKINKAIQKVEAFQEGQGE